MNTKNNSRYKSNSEKIESTFLSLIPKYKYENITITQICEAAGINRSTFYAHYDDINDMIIKIEAKFSKSMADIFRFGARQTNKAFVEVFSFVKKNKHFYKAFLNIPYATLAETNIKSKILSNIQNNLITDMDDVGVLYRASFFGAGFKEMCRIWLDRNCRESPEVMAKLLTEEYANRPECDMDIER